MSECSVRTNIRIDGQSGLVGIRVVGWYKSLSLKTRHCDFFTDCHNRPINDALDSTLLAIVPLTCLYAWLYNVRQCNHLPEGGLSSMMAIEPTAIIRI